MIHIILLGVLTVGAATLTFALMGLGSLAGAAYRSDGGGFKRSPQDRGSMRSRSAIAHRRDYLPDRCAGSGSAHN